MPKPLKFPPELKVRLTADWLIEHTNIFNQANPEEKPFSAMTAFRIKKRFKAYWDTWIAPDLQKLMEGENDSPRAQDQAGN